MIEGNHVNVDLGLHVINPIGEEYYYDHKHTQLSDRFLKDFTTQMGP
jgi:uncharacterized protein YfaP (DUF2135 family)